MLPILKTQDSDISTKIFFHIHYKVARPQVVCVCEKDVTFLIATATVLAN